MMLLASLRVGAAAVVAGALALSSGCAVAQQPRAPFTVKIIGFNDYHGNLQTPGTFGVNVATPLAQRPAVGGAEYMAGLVAQLKAQNPLNVVVGAGDFIGASPLVSALFFDEPAIETLNRIGMEFNAVGNHEFDKGSAELLRLQSGGCRITNGAVDPNSCRGAAVGTPVPFEGAKFKWLSANVVSNTTGKTLLAPYGIKVFNGVRMAFIGMTLRATPTIVTPTGVAGLTFNDEADTVNALVPRLRALGVEAIVVLVHQGGFQGAGLSDINGCDGDLANSDIARIVNRLDNAVDLVISGHTHAAYNCSANTINATATGSTTPPFSTSTPRPTGIPNASGRLIPVTSSSAFGRVITDIDVTIDPATRDITQVRPTNRLVDRTAGVITPAANVTSVVSGYNALVAPLAGQVIGAITETLSQANTFDTSCNLPAGNLIADAQLAATSPNGFGNAVIAFMNRGGVRGPFLFTNPAVPAKTPGDITYGEAFTIQPFGNTLISVTLTAQQIKDALEEQFAGCRGQGATTTRILIPSAGFRYNWNGAQVCNSRITNVTLTTTSGTETLVDAAGVLPDPTKPFRVTINNFLSTGGDGFSTFLGGTDPVGGAQDIDALVAHMQANYRAPNPPYNPNAASLYTPRINRLGGGTACPTGANVNP